MIKYLLLGVAVVAIGLGGWVFFNQAAVSPPVTQTTGTQNTNTGQPAQTSPTVQNISWHVESSNALVTEGHSYLKDEQLISVDVTFSDKSTKRYSLDKAYGCDGTNIAKPQTFGSMSCYYALTGVAFVAYSQDGKFIVERQDESAKDGSIKKTVVLEI